ncbi:fibroblast growth factor-binding protein 2b [Takifugu rubripes]|uniref:fibroblast growth factor-binding protein 2b n=1 Tax=Takifugu rubripes TaxID=31033 RepID=UPI0011455988|nr:fibroblast growth factor-binding protein 2 [Takifugu rubripes]
MEARIRALLLFCAAVCASNAQTTVGVWDEPIRFSTKAKDSCSMLVSTAGDSSRLRVSCKGPSQGQNPGRSYSCDFQGKPNLCRAYVANPRHYFTQIMWDMRKLSHACQGHKVYRPHMCRKYPDEAQMTFLTSRPRTTVKVPKPVQEQRKPAQAKHVKPAAGKGGHIRRTTQKPVKVVTRPTEVPDSAASRLATEYCWKSLHGVCSYIINWFQN